jgi:rubrerythrin
MALTEGDKKAEQIVGGLTEITPGRPTIFEHRDPRDEIRRPMTALAAETQSVLNALTVMAAEQQTMNFYMTIGNRPQEPLARGLYAEIAEIEEQHVSHYESILDPTASWLTNLVLHEYNECWLYWSFMQQEPDARVKALYELHLNMEIEHLRLACEMMRQVENRDPAEMLPKAMTEPLMFQDNKAYLRQVLGAQVDLTASEDRFLPIGELPRDHRYFAYQAKVNEGGVPSEQVIDAAKSRLGRDYRFESEGPNPAEGLRRDDERNGAKTQYAERLAA